MLRWSIMVKVEMWKSNRRVEVRPFQRFEARPVNRVATIVGDGSGAIEQSFRDAGILGRIPFGLGDAGAFVRLVKTIILDAGITRFEAARRRQDDLFRPIK